MCAFIFICKYMKANTKRREKKKGKDKVKVFTRKHFASGDGMMTRIWGPLAWTFLHTVSFNYPTNPTNEDKHRYKDLITNLQYILPCKYCRMNLTTNLKNTPLTMDHMANRDTFSRFVYNLHETVNKLLNKQSGLSYCDVRERYEHFRSRCTQDDNIAKLIPKSTSHARAHNKTKKKEKGCTEPLYGKKSKCVIQIVPLETKTVTFKVNKKCIKHNR